MKTASDLRQLQREMAFAIMQPLTRRDGMRSRATDGQSLKKLAAKIIQPNDRLNSFERLEIYNRQYWFRIVESFYEDYPGLRALLGDRKFARLADAYLIEHPSTSFTLRNLGRHLESFLQKHGQWARPHEKIAVEMARLEWAVIEAFDEGSLPAIAASDLAGRDPSRIKLRLQPHLRLVALGHALDDYKLALKRADRSASESGKAGRAKRRAKKTKPKPKAEPVFLAVHRSDNSVYYKRLTKIQFVLLTRLAGGKTLGEACAEAFLLPGAPIGEAATLVGAWFQEWAKFGWLCQPPG